MYWLVPWPLDSLRTMKPRIGVPRTADMVTTAAVIGSAPIDMPPTAAGMARPASRSRIPSATSRAPVGIERHLLAVEVVRGLLARGERELAELQGLLADQGDQGVLSYMGA